jgi:type I restriction enzyme S subunit
MSDLVPEGWSESTYESILEGGLVNGLYKHADYYGNGTAKILDIGYLFNKEKRSLNGCSSIELTDLERKKYKVNAGDILFNRVSVKPEGIGQCVHVDEHDFDLVFESNIIRSRLNKRLSDSLFISFLLNSDLLRKDIFTRAKITAQASIGQSDLLSLNFFLPPLPEQQKIAAILSSVDEVIEKTQAQINKLKDLKTGMMQELLSPREGQAANISNPQGESKNSLHHTEFKDSPLGRIPVGWEVVKTGDISKSIVPGRNKPKSLSGDIPWLTIADLDSFYVDKSKKNLGVTYENLREANGKTIPAKSVIMSVVGEFGISSVARCEMVINQQLHGFVCNEDIDPAFLCLSLRHHKLQQERLATQTTIAYMNKDNAESILFAKPPFSQQLKIAASILAVDKKINVLNSKHSSYINTKKALMQDLLTGKVRVTVPSHPCDHGISASMHVTVDAT